LEKKRVLIFVHFNPYGSLSSHVLYTLEHIKDCYTKVVFVSNSPLSLEHKENLRPLCCKIMERPNFGFDFGAWKDALLEMGWNEIVKFDTLTIMNDTCFGPLYEFKPIIEEMEESGIDFWGITNHRKQKSGMPGTNGSIPEHIQSYFLSFNHRVIVSKIFQDFWNKVEYFDDVNDVIKNYETQLTQYLINAGFEYNVCIDTVKFSCRNNNLATWQPDVLLPLKNPFIKIKSFLLYPHPQYLKRLIVKYSNFPISLIDDYYNCTYNPNVSIDLSSKNLVVNHSISNKLYDNVKVAMHIHVFYLDVFEKYLQKLSEISYKIDLFITTDTKDKEQQIIKLYEEKKIIHELKVIYIFKNIGRDILPWLKIAHLFNEYNVVGHFHTKKTNWADSWIGDSWIDEILISLIEPVDKLINTFYECKNLGIIISDIPFCYKNQLVDTWGGNKEIFNSLWNKMKCQKNLNAYELTYPVMSYGTMFWYRPNALKPLFELNLGEKDFPNEPFPIDGTIAHAIERLLIYIAWNENYDFKIIIHSKLVTNSFFYKKCIPSCSQPVLEDKKQILERKIGKIVLWFPFKAFKMIKNILKR